MFVGVKFNTIVHPFTLADNRHYVFYIFRLLLRHPLIKYAAVPVYFLCAWLVIDAMGEAHRRGDSRAREKPIPG
jgi:alpha-1,2-glucosyltransferase